MEDKPRIDDSRDYSTEVTSRMKDGDTPVGGPLVSAKSSSRSEGVPPSRKRGSEDGGLPKDAMLEYADVSNNVHQRDDSDLQVAGFWCQQVKGSRICFCEIW